MEDKSTSIGGGPISTKSVNGSEETAASRGVWKDLNESNEAGWARRGGEVG